MERWLRDLQIVCLDLSKIHSSCGPKFWSNACIVNLSRICSASKPDFNNSYRLICMSKLDVWVTDRKQGSRATFSYTKFLARSWQNFAKNLIYSGRLILPRDPDSATGRVSDIHNSPITNCFGPFDGPSESWGSYLPFGIWNFRSVSQSEAQRLRSVLPLSCPEPECWSLKFCSFQTI
jgi:hypothetical protein